MPNRYLFFRRLALQFIIQTAERRDAAHDMHYDAYIFDLDGTLVDSLQDIHHALNAALADHHLPAASPEQVRGWVGEGLRMLCRRACAGVDEQALESVFRGAETHYARSCVRTTRPYPNILKMLNLLARRGARLAVLSNKPHALTIEVVRRLKLDRFFIEVSGAQSEQDRKPAPAGARRLADRLAAPPSDILMVGDSLIDIETARKVGMPVASVTWGFRPVHELRAARPDFLVDSPMQIPFLVKKNFHGPIANGL